MAYDPKLSYAGVIAMMSGPGLGPVLNGGSLRIYDDTGDIPTHADDSNGTNVLLATLPLSNPAFGTCSGAGVMTAEAITDDASADATGTAAYGRFYTSGGACIAQGLVGTSGSDMVINSTAVVAGGNVSCSAATITMPRE